MLSASHDRIEQQESAGLIRPSRRLRSIPQRLPHRLGLELYRGRDILYSPPRATAHEAASVQCREKIGSLFVSGFA